METSANEARSLFRVSDQSEIISETSLRNIKYRMKVTRLPPAMKLELSPSIAKILRPVDSNALAKIIVKQERTTATLENLIDALTTICGIDVINECLHRVSNESKSCGALVDGLQASLRERNLWHGLYRRLRQRWQRSFLTKQEDAS